MIMEEKEKKSQILDNIEMAEQQRKNSEEKNKQYEDIILKSKNEAKKYFNELKEENFND